MAAEDESNRSEPEVTEDFEVTKWPISGRTRMWKPEDGVNIKDIMVPIVEKALETTVLV